MKKSILVWVVFSMSVFAGVWSEPVLVGRDVGIYPTIDNQGVCWLPCGRSTYKFDEETSSWQKVTESDFYGSSACFDKGDTLWVFNGNQDQIYYVRYYGGNWSDLDTVRAFPGGNSPPRVTVDSAGGVWVCWVRWAYEVACNRYKDGEWDEPQLIPDTVPGQDWGWDVTTDALGRVWFFWYIVGNESNSLHCRYNDNGTWSEQMLIRETDVKCYQGTMDFAPDSEGGIWGVWDKYRGDSIWVEAGRYKDGAWGSIDTVANVGIFPDGGFFPIPKIAVDGYGRAWAVWRQAVADEDSYGDIYYSFNAGSGWSTPAPVDTNPAVDQLPDIAVDGAGRVWCVWSSNRDDSNGVWASYAMSVGVEEEENNQPPKSAIECISPNPFRSSVAISYAVAGRLGSKDASHVEINVFDISGRQVNTLVAEDKNPGYYEIVWDGKDNLGTSLPTGVYFIRMNTNEFNASERVVLLR